jgi:hypothetical protein
VSGCSLFKFPRKAKSGLLQNVLHALTMTGKYVRNSINMNCEAALEITTKGTKV